MTNALIKATIQRVREEHPTALNGVDLVRLEQALQTSLEAALPRNIGLTSAQPDFETILLQFMQALQTDSAWQDVATVAAGQTILRNMASGLSALHTAILRATQENFSHLSQSDNATLANARFLGVNPRRRIPMRVQVKLTASDFGGSFSVAPLQEFVIGGVRFFNREQVLFSDTVLEQIVTLYEGTLYSAELVAEGGPLERISIGNNNGAISDQDVYVAVDGRAWTAVDKMWTAAAKDHVFLPRTDHDNVVLQFGDGAYGARLPVNATVLVQWAETEGDRAQEVPLNTPVDAPFVSNNVVLRGVTVGASLAGDRAVDPKVLRVMAPFMRASDGTAVNRIGFRAEALRYPGVVDAYFRGQAELAPGKRSWMNIYAITVLTRSGEPMTAAEWTAFTTWLSARTMDHLEWLRHDPHPIRVALTADVYCNQEADLNAVRVALEDQARTAFTPKLGSLGYSIFDSDVKDILEGNNNTLRPRVNREIEYARNVRMAYTHVDRFHDAALYPSAGLFEDDLVMPTPRYYASLTAVQITPHYTTRGSYSGRKDL